jgi:UPF0755 protein
MKYNRRPSVEIAKNFIELNIKTVIDAEKTANLTDKQRRKLDKAKRKSERKRHPIRNSLIVVTILGFLAAGSAALWWQTSIQPVNRADHNSYQFEIRQGDSTDQIAAALKKANFIRNTLAFKIYTRLNRNIIQAGTHMLSPSDSLPEIAAKLTRAETDEIDVQIPPGVTLKQLRDTLKKYDFTDVEIDQAFLASYDSDILADKPADASLEGYLYPDTYRIFAGDGLEAVIQKALDKMGQVVTENDLRTKFSHQGLTLNEALTLASIVVKEVGDSNDQKIVAGVFYNRLRAGMTLGSDVTFQYAFEQKLCADNTPDCDSIYNTRRNSGLPPGPIANPSLSALLAVAEPTESNYFYFVAGDGSDEGKTFYAETSDQHNTNVFEHCHERCQ